MANEKPTPDQSAAEKIGRAIDGQLFRLAEEKATLIAAATRITEIDAEVAILQVEKAKIDSRRPPKPDITALATDPVAQQGAPAKIAK